MRPWAFIVLAGFCGSVAAQPCPVFEPLQTVGTLGVTGQATFGVTFDPDGAGPTPPLLYMGGVTSANGIPIQRLMTWDGQNFAQVTPAPLYGYTGMATFDVGTGPMLYITTSSRLLRYSGTGWGEAQLPIAGAAVNALWVFDPDGAGPLPVSLHTLIGYPQTIYRYNAQGWTPISTPSYLSGGILPYDSDGPGPLPPSFYSVESWSEPPPCNPCMSGGEVKRLLSNGMWETIAYMSQSALGYSIDAANVYDADGPGPLPPRLILFGSLEPTVFGATSAAAWDGTSWAAIPQPPYPIKATGTFDPDGPGPANPLLICGALVSSFSAEAARHGLMAFDGTQWSPFGGGLIGFARLIREYNPGTGSPILVVAGQFDIAGNQAARNFAANQDGHWKNVVPSPSGPIHSLEIFNDGGGQKIFAGGEFDYIGQAAAHNIARWNGSAWQPVGSGVTSTQGPARIRAMAVHNDGSGWALYVGGRFDRAGTLAVGNVARWTGQQWRAVSASGLGGGEVKALISYDPDGPGPLPSMLYAGGDFTTAGGSAAAGLARWNGSQWQPVPGFQQGDIRSFRWFDDGAGRALYMAGDDIIAGGFPANRAARFNGTGWNMLPQLGDSSTKVNTLAIHPHGGGYRIHALGLDVAAVLYPGQWFMLPPPPVEVFAARSSGDQLYVGGWRLVHGEWRLNRWLNGAVRTLSPSFDDGNGASIFMGGDFSHVWVSDTQRLPAPQVARLRPCFQDCYANCDQSTWTALTIADFACFLQKFAAGQPYANCDQSIAPPVLNVADFSCFLQKFAAGCP